MPLLQLPDVDLAYELEDSGRPLTLLHGFTQAGATWEEVVSLLEPGVAAVLPDLRGHGRSRVRAAGECDLAACADDLVRLWDHLGLATTGLVGYSMGGRVALQVAVTAPHRLDALVLVSCHAGLPEVERAPRRAADDALAARIEAEGVAPFARDWASLPMFAGLAARGEQFQAELMATRLMNTAEGLAASLRGAGAGAMVPLWDRLSVIECPVLVVAGGMDTKYVEFGERLVAAIPNAHLELVAGAGHAVHLERPKEFAALLVKFLNLLPGPAPGAGHSPPRQLPSA